MPLYVLGQQNRMYKDVEKNQMRLNGQHREGMYSQPLWAKDTLSWHIMQPERNLSRQKDPKSAQDSRQMTCTHGYGAYSKDIGYRLAPFPP